MFSFCISDLCSSPAISRVLNVPTLEMGTLKLREIANLAKDAIGTGILTKICQNLKTIVLLLMSDIYLGMLEQTMRYFKTTE